MSHIELKNVLIYNNPIFFPKTHVEMSPDKTISEHIDFRVLLKRRQTIRVRVWGEAANELTKRLHIGARVDMDAFVNTYSSRLRDPKGKVIPGLRPYIRVTLTGENVVKTN